MKGIKCPKCNNDTYTDIFTGWVIKIEWGGKEEAFIIDPFHYNNSEPQISILVTKKLEYLHVFDEKSKVEAVIEFITIKYRGPRAFSVVQVWGE